MPRFDEILVHLGIIEKHEEFMTESRKFKAITGNELTSKLCAFDNFLEAMNLASPTNIALEAILHAFRMQFLDYYSLNANWESNSE